jgi:hypothetical protein
MIEIPDRACHDYLRSFNLGCVFIAHGCRIGAGSDLVHADRPIAAWWCNSRRSAEEVLTAVGERQPGTIEGATRAILAAAGRTGTTLSEHAVVVARAKAAVAALNTRIKAAQDSGALRPKG